MPLVLLGQGGVVDGDSASDGGDQDLESASDGDKNADEDLSPAQTVVNAGWHNLMLTPYGLTTNGKVVVCPECEKALRAGRMPKFAIANHLFPGSALEIPVLQGLSQAEKELLATVSTRGACYVTTVGTRFKGETVDRQPAPKRDHMKHSFISYEASPARLVAAFPWTRQQ